MFVREDLGLKTSRNAPCPCGSGKKYKKCCLPADEARRAEQLDAERKALAAAAGDLDDEDDGWLDEDPALPTVRYAIFRDVAQAVGACNAVCRAVGLPDPFDDSGLRAEWRFDDDTGEGCAAANERQHGALHFAEDLWALQNGRPLDAFCALTDILDQDASLVGAIGRLLAAIAEGHDGVDRWIGELSVELPVGRALAIPS